MTLGIYILMLDALVPAIMEMHMEVDKARPNVSHMKVYGVLAFKRSK